LVHDKFHVVKFLTEAIDQTRKKEVYEHPVLKRSKYVMLKRFDTMNEKQRAKFELINQSNTLTAKAWKMRENFLELYACQTEEEALNFFQCWYINVMHSNITAMKKAAKTIKRFIDGILHQIGNNISNARAEQTNSKIAKFQHVAQGYSNFANLLAAILFFNSSPRLVFTRLTTEPI